MSDLYNHLWKLYYYELFSEVEVNSGGNLPSREAARYMSTSFHRNSRACFEISLMVSNSNRVYKVQLRTAVKQKPAGTCNDQNSTT